MEDKTKPKKMSKMKLIRYFAIASNFGYTLVSPIILMLGLYLLIEKMTGEKHPIILIIFLLLGIITGYWMMYKQIKGIK